MSRLEGGAKNKWKPECLIDHLEVWSETLTDAARAVDHYSREFKAASGIPQNEAAKLELAVPDKKAIAMADGRAESMITDAQALDPRLVRRPSWVRSCEGETACPALLLAGEENAFFERRRLDTAGAASSEPVLVTVSTDSSEVSADSLAAFIATVKLVQQFRPVHVVWQGAWLLKGGRRGFVFHVPLVTGDMDFERLAFVINSKLRDRVSFSFMVRRAMKVINQHWNDAQLPAEQSYLPGSVDFVNHGGIAGDAESIAARACKWLGWDAPWLSRYNDKATASSALCRWEEGEESMRPEWKAPVYSEEQKAKWAVDDRERAKRIEKEKQDEIARRLAAVS